MKTAAAVLFVTLGSLGLGTIAWTGCSGDTDSGGGGKVAAAPVAEAELAAKAADALCNNVGKCCTDWGFQYDAATCAERAKANVQETIDKAAAAGGVTYNANAAGECLASYPALIAGCIISTEQSKALVKTCNAIWTGTKATGEPCNDDFECAGAASGTAECATESTNIDGGKVSACASVTQAELKHGTKAGACSGTCQTESAMTMCSSSSSAPAAAPSCWIDDSLYCDSKSWQCVDLVPVGGACQESMACAKDAYCKSGTCTARDALGSACTPSGFYGSCPQGARCSNSSKLCEALKADGQPCATSEECKSWHCDNGKCLPSGLMASKESCGAPTTP